ncbi:hypothetical protein SBRY_10553 [Actinacidiphila bryophytorum]|uniref:Uncharacterized protein n=1 Tax=Actinacidiphila bryophytorum TaxID=1436133 RepID=A0A9W4ECI1_9ACTN|nr:hypothetical protein SBRY_10553 [Actinacidiphila bryophytorum]
MTVSGSGPRDDPPEPLVAPLTVNRRIGPRSIAQTPGKA